MNNTQYKLILVRILNFDHVQLAMPVRQEDYAVAFYEGILGLKRVKKPAHLEKRGGCWFENDNIKLHLGTQIDFKPSKKAHVALLTDNLQELTQILLDSGYPVIDDEPLEGYLRIYTKDPFDNRIELMEKI